MKIIKDNCAYVQLGDIINLHQSDLSIPASIYFKVFNKNVLIVDNKNRHNFIKFDEEHEIEYFKSADWIIDYEKLKNLSEDELVILGEAARDKQIEVSNKYNALPAEERANHKDLYNQFFTLYYEMYGLKDLIDLKRGDINFALPEGVEYPEGHEKAQKPSIKKTIRKIKKYIREHQN